MDDLARSLVERIDALLSAATPGPWEADVDGSAVATPMDLVLIAQPYDMARPETAGDMRLIAAAPGLLAEASQALEEAHERGREAWEEGSSWGQNEIQKECDVLRERAERAEAERDDAVQLLQRCLDGQRLSPGAITDISAFLGRVETQNETTQ